MEREFGGVTSGKPEDKLGIRGSNSKEKIKNEPFNDAKYVAKILQNCYQIMASRDLSLHGVANIYTGKDRDNLCLGANNSSRSGKIEIIMLLKFFNATKCWKKHFRSQ